MEADSSFDLKPTFILRIFETFLIKTQIHCIFQALSSNFSNLFSYLHNFDE